jgi:hypothetical protein
MVGLLLLMLLLGAGVALAAQLAREHGRSQLGWGAVTLAAGLLGYGAGAAILAVAWAAATGGLLASLAGPLLSTAFEAIAIASLHALAKGDLALHGSSWPAFLLGSGDEPGRACELRLLRDAIEIVDRSAGAAPLRLPRDELAASVDGQCLRLIRSSCGAPTRAHGGRVLTLDVGRAGMSEAARGRLARAIERAIATRAR